MIIKATDAEGRGGKKVKGGRSEGWEGYGLDELDKMLLRGAKDSGEDEAPEESIEERRDEYIIEVG